MSNEESQSFGLDEDEFVDYPSQNNSENNDSNLNYAVSSQPLNLRPSIISEGFSFIGEIKAPGGFLTVDGHLEGTAVVQNLIVGSSGSVNGTMVASNVNVKGQLKGQLTTNDLVVGPQAIIDGQVTYDSIMIQRGGTIRGDLKRSN